MPDTATQTEVTSERLVDVTQAAATKLLAAIKDLNPETAGVRIGVSGGGCAGLQYDLAPAEKPDEGDFTEEFYGVRFYIHPMVLPYLKGTQLDFSDALMDGGFKFKNPNAANSCGCGTSFGV